MRTMQRFFIFGLNEFSFSKIISYISLCASFFYTSAHTTALLAETITHTQFEAQRIFFGNDEHYRVINRNIGKPLLTTQGRYSTPNQVQAGKFSEDAREFAAAYHYDYDEKYTWIEVWDIQTSKFLRAFRVSGALTTIPNSVFLSQSTIQVEETSTNKDNSDKSDKTNEIQVPGHWWITQCTCTNTYAQWSDDIRTCLKDPNQKEHLELACSAVGNYRHANCTATQYSSVTMHLPPNDCDPESSKVYLLR